MQEMKALLAKRDIETLRLRDQRDQYHSELNERKAKDAAKTSSLAEFESLAETRAVCFYAFVLPLDIHVTSRSV